MLKRWQQPSLTEYWKIELTPSFDKKQAKSYTVKEL